MMSREFHQQPILQQEQQGCQPESREKKGVVIKTCKDIRELPDNHITKKKEQVNLMLLACMGRKLLIRHYKPCFCIHITVRSKQINISLGNYEYWDVHVT
jgi:hypothetical protein